MMKGIICRNCRWYVRMIHRRYVPQIRGDEWYTEHYCEANGCRKLDWEEMEEIECPDYKEGDYSHGCKM